NLRGELTEGAISNVILEIDGLWFTPPVECGLLAGVYRRHLLESRPDETRPALQERVLTEEDLRRAHAVYLCNAIRGLRQVKIEWES
ncbi:MAG TPA: aminotransferase class IV, partial [Terracidiphilus sp.]|nr:aminotransferase class IV [Terracidiphilus sp.]